jgi:hypothetical protein
MVDDNVPKFLKLLRNKQRTTLTLFSWRTHRTCLRDIISFCRYYSIREITFYNTYSSATDSNLFQEAIQFSSNRTFIEHTVKLANRNTNVRTSQLDHTVYSHYYLSIHMLSIHMCASRRLISMTVRLFLSRRSIGEIHRKLSIFVLAIMKEPKT